MSNNHYVGLSDEQVAQSRETNGENMLTPPKKESLFVKFLEKFKDPLIIVLLIAGALSIGIALYEFYSHDKGATSFLEPVGIFVAIFLATGLAFFFEVKADREFEILNKVSDDDLVEVIRNGVRIEITKREVVVGDLVVISTGSEVPADGVLLEASSLKIDESTLTGEPICDKTTIKEEFDSEATFPSNSAMRGTKVMEGHGIIEVFAVGDNTENGKVFQAAQIDNSIKTPLNEQLERLGGLITKISYAFAALIIIGRLFVYFDTNSFEWISFTSYLLQTAMIAVTLIVVAVPEGLPMAITLSLAYSMRRMLKSNNLVRKMHACETMGATTVICTDKTGTLTQNQMRVHKTNFFALSDDQKLDSDNDSKLIVEGVALNTTASLDLSNGEKPKTLGNPTEGALLLWLYDNKIDYNAQRAAAKIVEELTFSTERKYMATVVESSIGKRILYVKGAPEIVHSLCKSTEKGVEKSVIDSQLLNFQNQAMRTLGFAYQILEENDKDIEEGRVVADNLTFMGVVAISDPVRAEVPDAIRECISAGIDVKIVTGDTPATAKEIGRQIGLWSDGDSDERNSITGVEFAELSDSELRERILDFKIISRARPMDKKRLVETLQALNQVVAVTGDGTNDAPALKAAHVGLSMGDGTSVAKEASDITIIDNSFNSISSAVMWGRSLYQNIQRFILFQITINVTACLTVLFGAFMGSESPLTVTQMLWVNIIMDTFAAMALASLPPSASVMKNKPRDRKDFIIDKPMQRLIGFTGGIFFTLLMIMLYIFQHNDITSLSDIASLSFTGAKNGLSPYEITLFFTTFVMLQFWNMFNARAYLSGRSAFHFKGCGSFVMIAFAIIVGQILIVSLGGEMFSVVDLKIEDWITIILSTSLVLWIGEGYRAFKKLKNRA